jgi:hypothetical protein
VTADTPVKLWHCTAICRSHPKVFSQIRNFTDVFFILNYSLKSGQTQYFY